VIVKFGKCFLTRAAVCVFLLASLTLPVMAEQSAEDKTKKTEVKTEAKPAVDDKAAASGASEDKAKKTEAKPAADGKAAVINGTIITQEELNRAIEPYRQQMAMQGQELDNSQLTEVKKNILEGLINRELLYQESQKKGIKIEDATITQQLTELKGQFPSEETFKEELKKMNLTEDLLKTQIKSGMIIEQFINEQFDKKTTIPDKEVKEYYDAHPDFFKQPEKVKASHILIKADEKADKAKKDEARKKLEGIQQKVQKGEDFGTLAKEFSEDSSNTKGGDLGYFGRGKMVKPFEDAAFALKSGDVSNIVETKFGYHLIKVTDKKAEGTTPYEEVKSRIEKYLKEEKVQSEVRLYVDKLKETAKIERFIQ